MIATLRVTVLGRNNNFVQLWFDMLVSAQAKPLCKSKPIAFDVSISSCFVSKKMTELQERKITLCSGRRRAFSSAIADRSDCHQITAGERGGDGGASSHGHGCCAVEPRSASWTGPSGTDGLRVELGYTGMKRRRRNPKRNVRMGGCSRSFLCVGWRRANGANPASSQSSSAIKFGENI